MKALAFSALFIFAVSAAAQTSKGVRVVGNGREDRCGRGATPVEPTQRKESGRIIRRCPPASPIPTPRPPATPQKTFWLCQAADLRKFLIRPSAETPETWHVQTWDEAREAAIAFDLTSEQAAQLKGRIHCRSVEIF